MICEGMKLKAKSNTMKLLNLPIYDQDLFNKIKQLPFFHIEQDYSLGSILRTGKIYSSRHITKHLRKKYLRGNTYPTDVNAGLDSYVFLSFGTIFDFGNRCPYGDVLMEFDNSIIDLPDCYFTPKDISFYESLWLTIHHNPDIPMNKHRSAYIDQFYELSSIYHYMYHSIKKSGIENFDSLLKKIYELKIYPPEVKIYHSLSLDYLKNIYLIPNKHYLTYVKRKKYKGKIEIAKDKYSLIRLTHIILKRKFENNFKEITNQDEINTVRTLMSI
jgi:hypothetical protein